MMGITPTVNKDTQRTYDVQYTGSGSGFATTGGAGPGGQWRVGVNNYSAAWGIAGNNATKETVDLNNQEIIYQRGHILPLAAGGGGGADNIFQQNSGQNNSGSWKSVTDGFSAEVKKPANATTNYWYRAILTSRGNTQGIE